MSKRSILIQNV